MFESATPELLRKIAGVIAEHGCKDEKEWMKKSPWYREFELGRFSLRWLLVTDLLLRTVLQLPVVFQN